MFDDARLSGLQLFVMKDKALSILRKKYELRLTFYKGQLLYYIELGRRAYMNTDFLLIGKAKNGSGQAGEQFIHDGGLAEDMTQETFTRFFESLQTYTDYGKIRNYLYRIAGNIIKNYYKKKKEIPMEKIPEMRGNDMMDAEVRMDIEQAVDHLPEELKEITILFFFQELKQKDIAKLLNINLSLVKYRIGRAKKLLSEYLEVRK